MGSDEPPPPVPALVERATAALWRRFRRRPTHVASAPGRVNLMGDHTDYGGGLVLPVAIDRHAVVVAAAGGAVSRLYAVDLRETETVAPGAERGGWSGRVIGVAGELNRYGERHARAPRPAVRTFDLALTSSVPIGAGLSSSAAIEVATATLLAEMSGIGLDPLEKARLCRRAEHHAAGVPCGIMDVYVAARPVPGHALLIDCRSLQARPIPLPRHDRAALLVADTGVRRDLAAGGYRARRETCRRAAAALGLESLREADAAMIRSRALGPRERRCAAHVLSENTRVEEAARCLAEGDLARLGSLMFQSHHSLRDRCSVSCPELETLIAAAQRMHDRGEGVLGARMSGGGFGGCAIVLCRRAAAEPVRAGLVRAFAAAHGRAPAIFEVF